MLLFEYYTILFFIFFSFVLYVLFLFFFFFFSSRRRHTRCSRDWSSDVCSSDLIVNKFIFAPTRFAFERALLPMRPIERGDIVVFKFPEEPERDFIKRVIGLPGDTLELRNQTVSINGRALTEPYTHYLFPPAAEGQMNCDLRRKYGPVTVPDGHYFMMGDNRDDSQDSRFWGFLPQSYVKGRALFIYWSFDTPDDGAPGGFAPRWGRLFHQIH